LDANNLCAGLANVIVEDSNGCLATNSVIVADTFPVIVIITVNGNSLESTAGFVSYQWLDENENYILGETSQTYTPSSAGEYYVLVTDLNGCTGKSTKINFIIESIENENNLVSVYPNPTNSWITISSSVEITENIRIINTHGETVITIEKEELNNNSKRVNMDGLSKGIYLIQLINNDYIINHKVILQ
ncbi:MAG: T9SS type A sorting domain-containing protein, partial [Flavobacteriales bacterium]|nr:T9SS type A sorting domain-containing protein [Flavobacteriales bacterium]